MPVGAKKPQNFDASAQGPTRKWPETSAIGTFLKTMTLTRQVPFSLVTFCNRHFALAETCSLNDAMAACPQAPSLKRRVDMSRCDVHGQTPRSQSVTTEVLPCTSCKAHELKSENGKLKLAKQSANEALCSSAATAKNFHLPKSLYPHESLPYAAHAGKRPGVIDPKSMFEWGCLC